MEITEASYTYVMNVEIYVLALSQKLMYADLFRVCNLIFSSIMGFSTHGLDTMRSAQKIPIF